MKELGHYLHNELITSSKQFLSGGLLVVLMTLGISLFFSFSFNSTFQPTHQTDTISVSVTNHDSGQLGDDLISILNSENLADLIEVEEDSEYTMIIPENFSENIGEAIIEIHVADGSSQSAAVALQSIIGELQSAIQEDIALQVSLGEEYDQYLDTYQSRLSQFQNQAFETVLFSTPRTLSAVQFQSLANLLILILFMCLSETTVASNVNYAGIRKRTAVAPIDPLKRVIFDAVSMVIYMLVLGIIYIAIWKIIAQTTFLHNPLYYLIWFSLYALMFTSLTRLLLSVFSGRLANIIMSILFQIYFFLTLIPLEDLVDGQLGEWFSTNWLKDFMLRPFVDYFNTGEWGNHWSFAVIILLLSVITILLTGFIARYKEVGYRAQYA